MALGGCVCAEQSQALDKFFSVLGFGHFVPFGRSKTMDRSSTSRAEKMPQETPSLTCFLGVATTVPVAFLSGTPQ